MTKRLLIVAALLPILLATGARSAVADPGDGVFGDLSDTGSVVQTLSRDELGHLGGSYFRQVDAAGPLHDYAAVSACGNPRPGDAGADDLCPASWGLCRIASGGGDGPAVSVWRREVERDGTPVAGASGEWVQVALTCWPEQVPGAGWALTMAMIQDAFHDTDFTLPTVNIQPEGDVTLVNLPTYFEVTFPEAGFGPDEVDQPDPARLLGYRIEVRPRLKSVTYHLGERTLGPTTDLGGPYPTGTVVQTYTRPGEHQVRVDIVYTGQFRVGGSGWIDIPGEVDLQGTPVTLTVREAKSRLYTS